MASTDPKSIDYAGLWRPAPYRNPRVFAWVVGIMLMVLVVALWVLWQHAVHMNDPRPAWGVGMKK